MPPHHVIVGTAGHIDHGKTSLVKALTGIDADRLEEEKRRGITIDLGFADVQIGETHFAFIDVPGHERFVRNMLAGIGGIDIVLLAVAADEGVKPQTREHFDICRLLGIKHGLVALTKSDLSSDEARFIVKEQVRELVSGSFLESAPVLEVSALHGTGVEELRRELWDISRTLAVHDEGGIARLPIDRVFTMKGFGTVITGTLVAGVIKKEDELEVHPSGRRVRVRGIQVHGKRTHVARAGQRTAINLAGVEKSELARGMMLAAPGVLRHTVNLDAEIALIDDARALKPGTRLHLHAYSAEAVANVKSLARDLGRRLARLRLDEPLQLVAGDRFILRQFSPVVTIGGGTVISPFPAVSSKLLAAALASLTDLAFHIEKKSEAGATLPDLMAVTGRAQPEIMPQLEEEIFNGRIVRFGESYFSSSAAEALVMRTRTLLESFHATHRLSSGMNTDELRSTLRLAPGTFSGLLERLESTRVAERAGDLVRLPGSGVSLQDNESAAMQRITQAFVHAGLKVPSLPDVLASLKLPRAQATKIVTLLLRDRTLVKLGDDLVFHKDALAKLRGALADYKSRTSKTRIDVAAFKDLAGISRKYAIPLLEHLDRERVTRREGNIRVIL